MIGVVISNQRGGVGKTTTAVNLAGYLAARSRKVLLVDTDSQGSVLTWFEQKPTRFLSDFVIGKVVLSECVTPVNEYLDLLCSNRDTQRVEAALLGETGRELMFDLQLRPFVEDSYDWVILDVAPSINLLQSCAMIFAGNVLIPVAMDFLSLQGAQSSLETTKLLNQIYRRNIRVTGFLPTNVNARLQVAAMVTSTLESLSKKTAIPLLPPIRVDQSVHKAGRGRQFIFDYDPKSRAAEDYTAAFDTLAQMLEDRHGDQAEQATA